MDQFCTINGEAVPSRRLLTRSTSYIPYGEVFVEESSAGWHSPYYFNSKELDEETGLYYYGARYLNPTETRWLSVDNKFEKFPGLSPYHYCHSNPVKLVDPDGNEDYFSEEGKYLGWAGEKEGYKLVDEKSWRLAKKAANKKFGKQYETAINLYIEQKLSNLARDIQINDKEKFTKWGEEYSTTAEYIKYISDQDGVEYGIDVVLNAEKPSFEYAFKEQKGTPDQTRILKKHRNGVTIGNIHAHPTKNLRNDSWNNLIGDSDDDKAASRAIGIVINIESGSAEIRYTYYLYGGNAQTYNGGSDAKSIINFMLEKLTER